MTEHAYEVFGLRIAMPSTMSSSQLTPLAQAGTSDVVVRYADVPMALENIVAQRFQPLKSVQVMVGGGGEVQWNAPFGRFLARDGSSVAIELASLSVEPSVLLAFVFSHCLPAVLIQRGILALHANAVATPAGALVIGGVSGVGKSTLLAGLIARGMPMLSDDITAIRPSAAGAAEVIPGLPHYRLCADALDRMALPAALVSALGGQRNKFSIAAPRHSYHAETARLRAMYLLETHAGRSVQVQPLQGAEKLQALRAMSFTPLWFAYLPPQVAMLAALASAAPIIRIRRPTGRWSVDELIEVVTGDAREQQRIA